ncbi:MAG: DNA-binding protein [Verrucomicrobiae bacterium]|nr:DNA-binding protein [Verrucomicrobiae bacterium]
MIGYDEEREHRRSDHPIHTEKVFADRKIFFLDLKENSRGRFVKITEDVRGRRDTIMVPAEVLDDFIQALNAIADADDANPEEEEE